MSFIYDEEIVKRVTVYLIAVALLLLVYKYEDIYTMLSLRYLVTF